jgi:hypothetical protein
MVVLAAPGPSVRLLNHVFYSRFEQLGVRAYDTAHPETALGFARRDDLGTGVVMLHALIGLP